MTKSLREAEAWMRNPKAFKKKTKRDLEVEIFAKNFHDKIKREVEADMKAKMDVVTDEQKKEFIRLFKSGLKLGEAAKQVGIEDTLTAARILEKQITPYGHYVKDIE